MSSVSRLVAELEAHLDARLLNRTTRRLSLTETGQAFFERCVQLLADLEEAEVAVSSASIVPRGTLRLTCSATFATRHLAPAIAAFAARHPQMRFDVELSERVVDIVEEGFDLAVRIGATGSQNLVGRLIGTTQHRVLRRARPISPATASRRSRKTSRGTSASPTSTRRRATSGRSATRDGRERQVRIAGPVHANNGRFNEALAAEGVGIAREPDFIVGPDVRAGRLDADTARIRAAAAQHLRRVSEPAPSVGEGARVRRFPGRALRDAGVGSARCRRTAEAATEAPLVNAIAHVSRGHPARDKGEGQ